MASQNAQIEQALRQQRELTAAVLKAIPVDLSEEDRNYWNGHQGVLNDQLGRLLRRQEVTQVGNIYVVTVDYGMPLKQMIAAGKYDWVNDNITQENFPITVKGVQEMRIELLHFDRFIKSEEVLQEFKKRGLREAGVPELLALGAAYPDLQRQFPIVELRDVWQHPGGLGCVACLRGFAFGRRLNLGAFEDGWDDFYRFAAVRE